MNWEVSFFPYLNMYKKVAHNGLSTLFTEKRPTNVHICLSFSIFEMK